MLSVSGDTEPKVQCGSTDNCVRHVHTARPIVASVVTEPATPVHIVTGSRNPQLSLMAPCESHCLPRRLCSGSVPLKEWRRQG